MKQNDTRCLFKDLFWNDTETRTQQITSAHTCNRFYLKRKNALFTSCTAKGYKHFPRNSNLSESFLGDLVSYFFTYFLKALMN